MNVLDWIWGVVTWCAHASKVFWDGILGWIGDPTGMWFTNVLLWLALFVAGWIFCAQALAVYLIKDLKGNQETIEHCSKSASMSWDNCITKHEQPCWGTTVRYNDVTAEAKRKVAIGAMGYALGWPAVPLLLVMLLPFVVFGAPLVAICWAAWLALLMPLFKGSRAVGNGIVNTTVLISEKTVDSIAERADQISKHKALESKKK